jgi:hypothetical protein
VKWIAHLCYRITATSITSHKRELGETYGISAGLEKLGDTNSPIDRSGMVG